MFANNYLKRSQARIKVKTFLYAGLIGLQKQVRLLNKSSLPNGIVDRPDGQTRKTADHDCIMYSPPNIVTVLGSTSAAVDVMFRKMFTHNVCPGTIVVLDYTGRGAIILSDANKMSLLKKKVHWFDVNDRRHTVRLLQLNNSPHNKIILERVLQLILHAANSALSHKTINWFVDTAVKFSESGPMNLMTLVRLLTIPEIKRLHVDMCIPDEEIATLLKLITWSLQFPSVYGISDGINFRALEHYFSCKTVVWIESLAEHLEKVEHQLVSSIIDIAVENAIKNYFWKNPDSTLDFTVVHIYPPQQSFPEIPPWIKEASINIHSQYKTVRHVSIHYLQPDISIKKITEDWIKASENIWVVDKVEPFQRNKHKNWLNDSEMNMIEGLEEGKVWLKSNKTGKAIIASVSTPDESLSLSYQLRTLSYRDRKTTSVVQMSTEVHSLNSKKSGVVGLYKKLSDKEFLRQGWYRVKEGKKDSHGIDKITIKAFGQDLEQELAELEHELKNNKYKCRPLRRVQIEKPEGGLRDLGVACIRDRVVQTSCLMLIDPFFEPDFSNYSFAYRPRRNAHHAISLLRGRIKTGFDWAVIADIKKCFDNIDHNVLLEFIERKVSDTNLINLIRHWLYVEVLEFNELLPTIVGVPQGESLSPLLSNIYLDALDKHLENLAYSFVRYADDIIIQTKTKEDAEKGLVVLENFLTEPLHLEVKPAKTNIASVDEGIDYLGFTINKSTIRIREKKVNSVFDLLETRIRKLADGNANFEQKSKLLLTINATIRGFRNYFALPEEAAIKNQLEILDGKIESLAQSVLPPEIKDDPAWICRERFLAAHSINEVETFEEESLRTAKTENGYPVENIYSNAPSDFIKDTYDEKLSVVVEEEDIREDEKGFDVRNSVFELNKRLFVLTHGSYLTDECENLVIKKRKKEIAKYKIENLGLVFLQGIGMNISVNLQIKLAEKDIPVVFSPAVGAPIAVVSSIQSSKAHIRRLQVLRRDDYDIIFAGLNMLKAKAKNQAAVLKYFYKYKKRKESSIMLQIMNDVNSIRELAEKISILDPKSENVRAMAMGYEGHAASIYWNNVKRLLPTGFNFAGRITLTAKDVVNQCFNYVYGILYGEVWRAVVKAGLDPYFGIIHGSQRDGGSMIFDLIEEFRSPFADRIVLSMFGRGFQPELNKAGLLKTKSKKLLAISFSKRWYKKIKWRSSKLFPAQILENQAQSISKLFNKEGSYFPFKMQW